MACPHGHPRHCQICYMEELERYYGIPEDHIDADDEGVADEA